MRQTKLEKQLMRLRWPGHSHLKNLHYNIIDQPCKTAGILDHRPGRSCGYTVRLIAFSKVYDRQACHGSCKACSWHKVPAKQFSCADLIVLNGARKNEPDSAVVKTYSNTHASAADVLVTP